jgi:hypothetical protein
MRLRVASLLALALSLRIAAVSQSAPQAVEDYSGMYSFLREGEFIQITIEEKGNVSGFISRFGDTEADKKTFLDQFIQTGKLDANRLTFTTKPVHASWFTFEGTIGRGGAKTEQEEGYYVIRGELQRFETGTGNKTTEKTQTVEFKSFPRD